MLPGTCERGCAGNIPGSSDCSVSSGAGKEALRLECLKETQRILKKETGSPMVEDLFFTSFVVQ